jgi:cytochrome c553
MFTILCAIASPAMSASAKDSQAEARAAIAAFGNELKAELMAAMQAGGPLNAIEVCATRAPAIAESVSIDSGMQLSRVSLRNRNPGNAPADWQASVLRDFEQRLAAGETAESLSWQEVADSSGRQEFRLMKAIPTAPLCLQCHGETIAPAVAKKIEELYPEDKATGFREGDIRGAFVVTKWLD